MFLAAQHLQLQAQLSALPPAAVDHWLRCGAAAAADASCCQVRPPPLDLLMWQLWCQHLLEHVAQLV
jgi:hypothetical protein